MTERRSEGSPLPDRSTKTRRSVLARTVALAAATASLAGCSDSTEPSKKTTPEEPSDGSDGNVPSVPDPFDRFVDLAEFGADPDGNEPIGHILQEAAGDGRLLSLPPGRYLLDNAPDLSGIERFGLVGNDATIAPSSEADGTLLFADNDGATDFLIDNLTVDFSDTDVNERALDVRVPDGLLVRDLTVTGTFDGGRSPVRVDVTDPDGTGMIQGLTLPDGGAPGTTVTGCYVGASSRGTITFKNCRIEGFPDNGLYADPPAGRIVVDGGYYANNGISNIRVRGGSLVTGVHVRCNDTESSFQNMRGIRLNDYEPDPDSEASVIENSLIEMLGVPSSDGAVTLSSDLARAEVNDTEIRVDAEGVHAIWVKAPHEDLRTASASPRFRCKNVDIVGDADNGVAIQIDKRDGCMLDGVDVDQPGENRNGLQFYQSRNNTLRNSRVEVGGEPIRLTDSTLETKNVEGGIDRTVE